MDLDFQNATGDQYYVNMNSKYPIFSDMNTSDYMFIGSKRPVNNTNATYEDLLRAEQYRMPATMKQIGMNPNFIPSEKTPMYKKSVDQRMNDLLINPNPYVSNQGSNMQLATNSISIDNSMVLFVFIFIVIIFMCFCYAKTISELKSQLKSLKELIKMNK
jgi:hypothetical protein